MPLKLFILQRIWNSGVGIGIGVEISGVGIGVGVETSGVGVGVGVDILEICRSWNWSWSWNLRSWSWSWSWYSGDWPELELELELKPLELELELELILWSWPQPWCRVCFSNEDLVARSRYLRQGWVVASHRILWDAITYHCLRYLLLATKSTNILIRTPHSWPVRVICGLQVSCGVYFVS